MVGESEKGGREGRRRRERVDVGVKPKVSCGGRTNCRLGLVGLAGKSNLSDIISRAGLVELARSSQVLSFLSSEKKLKARREVWRVQRLENGGFRERTDLVPSAPSREIKL